MSEYKIRTIDSIAIIPARKGSKRIPGKNIKLFYGKPIIYYAIKKAEESGLFSKILVTTDSKKIANIGKYYGAKVYFLRPSRLASDKSAEWLSWKHAVKFLINIKKYKINKILILPVTSPCRSVNDINGCINLFDTGKYESTMAISSTSLHPSFNMVKKNKSNKIDLLVNTSKKKFQRQQFANTYKLTTVSIVTKPEIILNKKRLFDGRVGGYEIPESRAIDIDSINDFNYSQYLFKRNK